MKPELIPGTAYGLQSFAKNELWAQNQEYTLSSSGCDSKAKKKIKLGCFLCAANPGSIPIAT